MIRLLFIIRALNFGGAQKQLVTLAKNLDKQKFDVCILTFYSINMFREELESEFIQVVSLDKKGRWDLLPFLCRTVRKVRSQKPQIVYSFLPSANLLAFLVKLLVPGTKTIYGMRNAGKDYTKYPMLERIIHWYEKIVLPSADLVIHNSFSGYKPFSGDSKLSGRMIVIQNGIDTQRFQPDLNSGFRFKLKHGISEQKIVMGLVGRLDPQKGHGVFLDAVKIIAGDHPDLQVICMGDSRDVIRQEFIDRTKQSGLESIVRWEKPRVDIENVYNAMDILCLSSLWEGFPNVVAEAMACGIPCIVTDVGDTAQLIGDTGWLVPPGDSRSLAVVINQVLQLSGDERRKRGLLARERVVKYFSIHRMVTKTEQAIQSLLNQSSSNDEVGLLY